MSRYEDAPKTECSIWGADVPWRGRVVAVLLSSIANVTLERHQREGDAETLASYLQCHPVTAWMRACRAAVLLGFGPRPREAWRQLVTHDYPGGAYPTARAWLRQADLDEDGQPLPTEERDWSA